MNTKTVNPIDLLPIDHPINYDPSEEDLAYFYENVVKYLIPDIVRIMNNGIPIDLRKIKTLESTVDNVLANVATKLASNKVIQDFQAFVYPKKFKALKKELEAKKRSVSYYLKEYKNTVSNRTWVVNTYLTSKNSPHAGKDKWTVKDLKGLNILLQDSVIESIIEDKAPKEILDAGMMAMAKAKLELYNKSIDTKIAEKGTKEKLLPPFNPASNKQKKELFEWLGINALRVSKNTGEPSWDREAIEELLETTDKSNTDLIEVLQLFVDYSFSAIIKTNFIESFKKYTIEGVLYGNLKLFGAKSFRLTSSSPNLLNMPSTTSIYAKPLKKCFIAPEGYVILTADYNALEDRVIANLSGDENKTAIFQEGLDGHSLAATYYFRSEVEKLIGFEITDHKTASRALKRKVDEKNQEAKTLRHEGKPVTFGLSYGAYPQKVANTIGCTLEEAESIANAYHNEMFPGITSFREIVTEAAQAKGYTHLGLGCRLYTSDIGKEVRTVFNANSQFWSILTLLTINKMHTLIDNAGYADDIKCISTIYDSIYFIVKEDAEIIKWLNDNLITTMCVDYLKDQVIPNTAESEIGRNWAELVEIPNKASVEDIEKTLKELP
jgi:DNA polymerase I-like protein with 3'-5' exonuclease and polymerase domains